MSKKIITVYVLMTPSIVSNIYKPRAVFKSKKRAEEIKTSSEYLEPVVLNSEKVEGEIYE